MSAIHINRDNYRQEVLNSDKPVLLDFWAPWCGPCRRLSPVIDQIAGERPDIKVGKVNVDEEMELSKQFRAYSIPMLVLMQDGKVLRQLVGARPKEQILALL